MKIIPEKIKVQIDQGDELTYKGTTYKARVNQSFIIERRIESLSGKTLDYVVGHSLSKMQLYAIKKYYPNNERDYILIALWKWKQYANKDREMKDYLYSYWDVKKIKKV